MSNHPVQKKQNSFGRRSESHVVTISKGEKTRTFIIRPVYFAAVCSVASVLMLGYLGATAYLVLRDDLIGATLARQARLQHKYEDRIAALRSRIDLITSQQLLEQQAVETRVQELVNRQNVLGSRAREFSSALKKAAVNGVAPAIQGVAKLSQADITGTVNVDAAIITGSINGQSSPRAKLQPGTLAGSRSQFSNSTGTSAPFAYLRDPNGIFANVENSLLDVENQQILALKNLRSSAIQKTIIIAKILRNIGVDLPKTSSSNIGGPLIELDDMQQFHNHMTALDGALLDLNNARSFISQLPVGSPGPGRPISSRYGRRNDPFLHRAAMHAGLDFKASRGYPVRSTGAGKVTKAGYNGGYGRMVEVSHGNGLITRYAHLSRVDVKLGMLVKPGTVVGKVGSTGRSTGPHLHYEVRHGGKAQNPARYVAAGRKLKSLL